MAHVRHFDRAIRLLADRGHEIVVASQENDTTLREVLADHPAITATVAPPRRLDDWAQEATALRRTRDYVRYLHPRYADALLLRRRAFEKMVGAVSGREEDVGAAWAELMRAMNKSEQRRLDSIWVFSYRGRRTTTMSNNACQCVRATAANGCFWPASRQLDWSAIRPYSTLSGPPTFSKADTLLRRSRHSRCEWEAPNETS